MDFFEAADKKNGSVLHSYKNKSQNIAIFGKSGLAKTHVFVRVPFSASAVHYLTKTQP